MDLEEYYDSLDEDSNYGSIESLEEPTFIKLEKDKFASKIPVKTKAASIKSENDFIFEQEDDVVPFYDQSLSKSEVDLKKTFSKNLPMRKPRKKNPPVPITNGKLKSNSYLNMFYAKIGVEKIDLTNRATCRDLTPKNWDTCRESFANSSGRESARSCSDVINEELSLSLTSLDSKMFSVSQQNLKVGCGINLKKNYRTTAIHLPVLGSLGPEIPRDKLDLLKKRQEYGRKVSQKNKIRMIEKKLLQNLQREIKECNKINTK